MARQKEKISALEYGIGASSFIPGLGVFIGVGTIILGALKFKAGGVKLIVLGVAGILFSVVVGIVVYRQFSGKVVPESIHRSLAQDYLKQSLMAIEYYKVVHGVYPDKLDLLQSGSHHNSFIYDFTGGRLMGQPLKLSQYEVQPGGNSYVLFDVGPDGVSGTADDIFPEILAEEVGHIGYIKK